eukprot:6645743-Ditylum_brightwellii.AAC.2
MGKYNGNGTGVAGSSGDGATTTGGTSKGTTSGIDGLMGLDVNGIESPTTHHRTTVPMPSTTATITTSSNEKNLPSSTNHICFFKNGEVMGYFIVSRCICTGGQAFDNIKLGHYFPAISTYMSWSLHVNFGPHFIYPPQSLPNGFMK